MSYNGINVCCVSTYDFVIQTDSILIVSEYAQRGFVCM